ncbi:hypothetical protein Pelo_5693 [Pelomyxa schiedti]|nr:hypothetical protein Pelo_5693 [Pelomyxa schiedti]
MGGSDSKPETRVIDTQQCLTNVEDGLERDAQKYFKMEDSLGVVETKEDVVKATFSSGMNDQHIRDTVDTCFARSLTKKELTTMGKEVFELLMKQDTTGVERKTNQCRCLTIETPEGKKDVRVQFVVRIDVPDNRATTSTLIVGYKMRVDIIQGATLTPSQIAVLKS